MSAILLDDDYYKALLDGKTIKHGLSVLRPEYLILFKAKAYLDLTSRKENGEQIDSINIRKHKNDILKIAVEMVLDKPKCLSKLVRTDIDKFIISLTEEPFDSNLLKGYGLKTNDVMTRLADIFQQ